jgi:septal ring factor EnvC (AmiA/AmiB activator)
MVQYTEQIFVDPNVMSLNPTAFTSHPRIFDFLEDIAENARGESTAIDRKIAQLKCQRKKLRENIKKTKQRITEQTEKLRLFEELDNIELNISHLQSIRDNDEEPDLK